MTLDEGYIKYHIDWTPAPAPDTDTVRELERWRRPLFEAGLIGHYKDLGIGFGNLSKRCGSNFLISGTQTGHLETTSAEDYSLVTSVDIQANSVRCEGPVQASSEAMTHAAIYELDPDIVAVVHIHSKRLWKDHLNILPTTSPNVAYGTPEMARELARLYAETEFDQTGVAVMGGHEEGIISFGPSLEIAATRLLSLARPGESEPT